MRGPFTIAATLALLLAAAPPAGAEFVEQLRESVELSKQQERGSTAAGARSGAGKAAKGERPPARDDSDDRAAGSVSETGARRERKKRTRGSGKRR